MPANVYGEANEDSVALVCLLTLLVVAQGATFTNGDFETGDATGWTIGGGYRASTNNPSLTAVSLLPGGPLYNATIASNHSSIVTPGLDPNTGNALNQVYSGKYSWRVEDTGWGGYASAISQTVINYTDPNIFFAWAAVLEGAHGPMDAATVKIFLSDLTAGDTLVAREYNAASGGGGVDPRFTYNGGTNMYWTPWQIENLSLGTARMGHDFQLSILASDCQPTAHLGYLYLDGFGAAPPPPGTPEPGTWLLLGSGLAGLLIRHRLSSR